MAGVAGLGGFGGGLSPRAPPGSGSRPSTAPRHDGDVRKRQLAAKRKELVEARLRPAGQGSTPSPSPWQSGGADEAPTVRPVSRPPSASAAAGGMIADARTVAETHAAFSQALAPRTAGNG